MPIVLGMIGILLVSVGIFSTLFLFQQKEPEIEIISGEEETGTIWIDLAGAVINPGVYELPSGSRLKDLLARAKSIIDNRPYSSIDELLDKKIIPSNVFDRIKDEITVF